MKSLHKFYLFLVVTIGLMIVNQIFIQYFLQSKKDDAIVINVAGRQRMLSQRINQLAFRSAYFDEKYSKELMAWLKVWKNAQITLIDGDSKIRPTHDIKILQKLHKTQNIILEVDSLLTQAKAIDKSLLSTINIKVDTFLPQMESIVKDFQKEADWKLKTIIFLEISLTIFAILVLFVIFYLFIKPSFNKVLAQNVMLKKIAWQQSHELRRPVANILGLVEMLKSSKAICDETDIQTLNFIHDSAEQLEGTVDLIVENTQNKD